MGFIVAGADKIARRKAERVKVRQPVQCALGLRNITSAALRTIAGLRGVLCRGGSVLLRGRGRVVNRHGCASGTGDNDGSGVFLPLSATRCRNVHGLPFAATQGVSARLIFTGVLPLVTVEVEGDEERAFAFDGRNHVRGHRHLHRASTNKLAVVTSFLWRFHRLSFVVCCLSYGCHFATSHRQVKCFVKESFTVTPPPVL